MLVPKENLLPKPYCCNGDGLRPNWSEELQRLYNRWRDSVYFQEFDNFLQEKRKSESLTVPSLGRSLSVTSGGSSSSSAPSAEEDEPIEQDQKPRRRGPLSKSKREKTAFIRRLGACSSCRTRKVGCKHWDLSEFEQRFQRLKEYERNTALSGLHLQEHMELAPPSHGANLQLDMETPSPLGQWQFSGTVSLEGQLQSYAIPMNQTTQYFEAVDLSSQPLAKCSVPTAELPSGKTKLTHARQLIAIGNDLAASSSGVRPWQCLFGSNDLWLSRDLDQPCSGRFDTADDIVAHILTAHQTITLHDSPIWFKCRSCAQWNTDSQYCLQCEDVEGQEQWIHGYNSLHCRNRPLTFGEAGIGD